VTRCHSVSTTQPQRLRRGVPGAGTCLFSVQTADGMRYSIDVNPLLGQADSGNLADDTTDLLVATGEAAASRGKGVLLCIDQVQYLDDEEFGALITATHRTTQLWLTRTAESLEDLLYQVEQPEDFWAFTKQIQAMLGHASIGITMDVYGHLFESLAANAADALDEGYRAAQGRQA
jgi:hypothetical protein